MQLYFSDQKLPKEVTKSIFLAGPAPRDFNTINSLGEGAKRTEGEVNIPLFIWNTEQFKNWYKNLINAENQLINAKVLHHFNVLNYQNTFSFVIQVNIWVKKEKRFKLNEFISSRKDISSVVAYYPTNNGNEILFIKEFRSPVNNPEGFITELPSGSSMNDLDPKIKVKNN